MSPATRTLKRIRAVSSVGAVAKRRVTLAQEQFGHSLQFPVPSPLHAPLRGLRSHPLPQGKETGAWKLVWFLRRPSSGVCRRQTLAVLVLTSCTPVFFGACLYACTKCAMFSMRRCGEQLWDSKQAVTTTIRDTRTEVCTATRACLLRRALLSLQLRGPGMAHPLQV
jgi:hypothetical protein